jgi:hypothetical protein
VRWLMLPFGPARSVVRDQARGPSDEAVAHAYLVEGGAADLLLLLVAVLFAALAPRPSSADELLPPPLENWTIYVLEDGAANPIILGYTLSAELIDGSYCAYLLWIEGAGGDAWLLHAAGRCAAAALALESDLALGLDDLYGLDSSLAQAVQDRLGQEGYPPPWETSALRLVIATPAELADALTQAGEDSQQGGWTGANWGDVWNLVLGVGVQEGRGWCPGQRRQLPG